MIAIYKKNGTLFSIPFFGGPLGPNFELFLNILHKFAL